MPFRFDMEWNFSRVEKAEVNFERKNERKRKFADSSQQKQDFERRNMSRRFQINEQIGDYRIVEFIGQGGMGEVYHFYHEKLNRSVAVKVLGANGGLDPNYKARFLNEARLQSSLQHPNIAAFYDFKELGNELLIFMELVDGETLEKLSERQSFSIEESLRIFDSLVDAIGYVHSNGIIHRDIKAENVKINSSGVPKLLDFGIAKDTQSQALTRVGGVIGTPKYLAPEQFDAKPASVQTDIWSLGILFYKMLTGKTPFEGDRFEHLILQIIQGNFTSAETLNPAIPKEVSDIINKCLAMDPNHRYQSTNELRNDIRQILKRRYLNEQKSESPKKRNSISLLAYSFAGVGVFLIFFLSTIAIVTLTTSGEPTKNNENTTKNSNSIIVKKDDSDVGASRNNVTSIQNSSEKESKTIRIDTIGGSAEVWRDGQKLGTTPLDLKIKDNETINLKLKRDGFLDSNVPVNSTKNVYTFSLEPK